MSDPKKHFTLQQLDSFRRAAKVVAKARGIAHTAALDEIAVKQGYKNWSMLARAVNRGASQHRIGAPAARARTSLPSVVEMVEWFRANHTLAVEESPWNGREGGYQYPVIEESSEIEDILRDQFPGALDADIEAAAQELDDGEPWLDPEFTRIRDEEAAGEMRELDATVVQAATELTAQQPIGPAGDDLADQF